MTGCLKSRIGRSRVGRWLLGTRIVRKTEGILNRLGSSRRMTFPAEPFGYVRRPGLIQRLVGRLGQATELPDTLIIPPGSYSYGAVVYNCSEPGVYCFCEPLVGNAQRIVLGSCEPLEMARLFSMIIVRGNRDNDLLHEDCCKKALEGPLVMTCGSACAFVGEIVRSHGGRCREVGLVALGSRTGFDDGHIMLEVASPRGRGQWSVVDVDAKATFMANKRSMDLFAFCGALSREEVFEIELFASSGYVDWAGFVDSTTGYDFSFVEYLRQHGEGERESWYARLATAFWVDLGTERLFTIVGKMRSDEEVVQSWRHVSLDDFKKIAYPQREEE